MVSKFIDLMVLHLGPILRVLMGPLQLTVIWYKIHHAGEQAMHWDIQNKENSHVTG